MFLSNKKKMTVLFCVILSVYLLAATPSPQEKPRFDPFSVVPDKQQGGSASNNASPVIPQVEFTNNDITMVLQIISDATGWSIFPTEAVSKAKINFFAKNITAQQLLDTIVEMAGFIYYRSGNIISVMTYDEYVQYHGLEKKVFQLKYGNAATIEAAVKPFLSKIGKTVVHKESNTIVLYESPANLEYITQVVDKLDIPLEEVRIIVLTLNYAKAIPTAQTLTEVFAPPKESPQQVVNSASQTTVSVDTPKPTLADEILLMQQQISVFPVEHSNQVVLVGSNAMVDKAQDLISKIDIKGDNLVLEVIDLQFADAVIIEETLQQMFQDDAQDRKEILFSNQNPTAAPPASVKMEAGLLNPEAPVGVYAIGRTNQVIVKAFRADMDIIKSLISKLDTYIEPVTQNYHFAYVDVSEIYTGLERIMNIYAGYSSSTGSFSSGRSGTGTGYGRSGITLVEKSNSILLTAPPSAHRIMESIKSSIDTQSTFETGMIRVYKIENADVQEIAQTIKELLDAQKEDESKSSQVKFKDTAPAPGPETDLAESGQVFTKIETSVSVSTSTNSVVVMATARQHRELEQLITELDRRRKQVLIEAKIVEITTSDDFNFGVELGYANADTSLFSFFGLSSNLDPETATRDIIVSPGGTAALLNPDKLQLILQALKSNGNIRINSAPQVLVNDNAVGFINSVNEEPYTTTTQGTTSDQTSFGGFVEAGTQFAITPHISKDNYLRVEYQITLNSFTDDSSDPTVPPPRSTNTIQSEATVPDGYTIVVGGLQTSDEKEAVSKFPILGDIPVLDLLFKNTSIEKTYKTVFLFITPHIMEKENFDDLKDVSQKALDNVASKNKPMIPNKKADND